MTIRSSRILAGSGPYALDSTAYIGGTGCMARSATVMPRRNLLDLSCVGPSSTSGR
jgi:hypothetical protein